MQWAGCFFDFAWFYQGFREEVFFKWCIIKIKTGIDYLLNPACTLPVFLSKYHCTVSPHLHFLLIGEVFVTFFAIIFLQLGQIAIWPIFSPPVRSCYFTYKASSFDKTCKYALDCRIYFALNIILAEYHIGFLPSDNLFSVQFPANICKRYIALQFYNLLFSFLASYDSKTTIVPTI